jgi:hypothetical protein
MGDIVPFLARVRSSGEWTAGERARLEELADRFAGVAEGIEVVFGATDEGDPWCVVKDAQDEILVHVARIGGRFIIHYALDDALREGADLPTLLGERLRWAEDEEADDVVVPFSRQAQSLLALIIATAFFFETAHLEERAPSDSESADPGPLLTPHLSALAGLEAMAGQHLSSKAASGLGESLVSAGPRTFAAANDPAPAAPRSASGLGDIATVSVTVGAAMTLPEAAAAAPPTLAPNEAAVFAEPVATWLAALSPTSPNVDSPGVSPPGVDPSGPQAPQGPQGPGEPGPPVIEGFTGTSARQTLVEGTDGDDRMEMGERIVANGGGGADTFVIRAPGALGDSNTALGVIADFRPDEGDRLVTADGAILQVLNVTPTATTLAALPTVLRSAANGAPSLVVTGREVQVDLNGDGKADGFVILLTPPTVASPPPSAIEIPVVLGAPSLVGHALEAYDL